ncbi:uncharacterized protein HMPREF1541_04884 [Cyphellophora europaea CBS 101466]|uniref:Uncharacterized protein n=1 Tax=Cyphellophora europaea (strain CBS 101466) TaxID=1220924 RepID=W2RVX7_CYPE1|nr:uncharacterized protein HMPREF1541_04884 [Cyphellophora europaea CBS 101466]ETN40607.1 hypothetical protein HMPREF1541_04884 [Cyphellophora europaea CBS 101466]
MPADSHPVPVRNDSTGSSSITSSGQSSVTPTITRNSSYSSVDDASPTPPPKDDSPEAGPTALPKVANEAVLVESPVHINKPSRSSTWGSTNSNTSQNLDLDKPLPIRPRRAGDVSKVVNFSRPNPSPVRTSQRSPSTQAHIASMRQPSRSHHRSASINVLMPHSPATSTPMSPPSHGLRIRSNFNSFKPLGSHPNARSRSNTVPVPAMLPELPGSLVPGVRPLAVRKPVSRARTVSNPANRPCTITTSTAESVIYRIMSQIHSVQDLETAALVSKGFYNTFARNESRLVSQLLFRTSPAAWETRRSVLAVEGSQQFRLREYSRDVRTLAALKRAVLRSERCASVCRLRTIAALRGADEVAGRDIDEALWRVWTFCAWFGDSAVQRAGEVTAAELDWLNATRSPGRAEGFATGNSSGLSAGQLEDMNEMWQCMQLLLDVYQGTTDEALRAGWLDFWNPSDGVSEAAFLQEWTSYLLTLGPQVVLTLAGAPNDTAKKVGLTRWPLPPAGYTRATFLTAALGRVYQERLVAEATAKAATVPLPRQASARHRHAKSVDSSFSSTVLRDPQAAAQTLRLDTSTPTIRRRPVSVSVHRPPPLEIRPDCDPASAHSQQPSKGSVAITAFPASPTTDPSFFHTLTMNRTASTRLGPNLFPVSYVTSTPRVPFPSHTYKSRAPPPVAAVVDPTDRALNYLVCDLGFAEQNAKRALAMTDTGSGIDLPRAEELLRMETRMREVRAPVELPTPDDIVSPLPKLSKRTSVRAEDRCNGHCPRPVTRSRDSLTPTLATIQKRASVMSKASKQHGRSKSLGNATDSSDVPISPITDIYGGHSDSDSPVGRDDMSLEWRREAGGGDTIAPLVTMTVSTPNKSASSLGRVMSGRSAKAWRVLGVEQELQQRQGEQRKLAGLGIGRSSSKSNVVGMNEYLERVERKKSMRTMAEQWKAQQGTGEVFGVPKNHNASDEAGAGSAGAAGASGTSSPATQGFPCGNSGGLGGLRPVVAAERDGRDESGRGWRRSVLGGAAQGLKREKTAREKARCLPGGERLAA